MEVLMTCPHDPHLYFHFALTELLTLDFVRKTQRRCFPWANKAAHHISLSQSSQPTVMTSALCKQHLAWRRRP